MPMEAGFDIASDGAGGNAALLAVGGTFHRVDMASGAVAEAGKVDGLTLRDIALLPAMQGKARAAGPCRPTEQATPPPEKAADQADPPVHSAHMYAI